MDSQAVRTGGIPRSITQNITWLFSGSPAQLRCDASGRPQRSLRGQAGWGALLNLLFPRFGGLSTQMQQSDAAVIAVNGRSVAVEALIAALQQREEEWQQHKWLCNVLAQPIRLGDSLSIRVGASTHSMLHQLECHP